METPKEESAENKRQFYRELFNEELYSLKEPAPEPLVKTEPMTITAVPKAQPKKPELPFKGNKNSSLLIIYSYPNAAIPPADETMLKKLVSAVGHDIEKVCKLNMTVETILEEVMEQSTAANIISFGVPMVSGMYKMNEVVAMEDRKIIVTYSVAELEANVDLKKALWGKLQEVFKK